MYATPNKASNTCNKTCKATTTNNVLIAVSCHVPLLACFQQLTRLFLLSVVARLDNATPYNPLTDTLTTTHGSAELGQANQSNTHTHACTHTHARTQPNVQVVPPQPIKGLCGHSQRAECAKANQLWPAQASLVAIGSPYRCNAPN